MDEINGGHESYVETEDQRNSGSILMTDGEARILAFLEAINSKVEALEGKVESMQRGREAQSNVTEEHPNVTRRSSVREPSLEYSLGALPATFTPMRAGTNNVFGTNPASPTVTSATSRGTAQAPATVKSTLLPTVTQTSTIVLAPPKEILESVQMGELSLKGLRYVLGVYRQYLFTDPDKSRRLCNFIRDSVLRLLVDNERRLGTDLSTNLNYFNVHQLDDKKVMRMITRSLRPQSKQQYIADMYAAVPVLKPSSTAYGDVFTVINYDKYMHGPVNRLIEATGEVFHIFRDDATPAELSLYPILAYGKHENPGEWKVHMKLYGKFEPNFFALIGEDRLKGIKDYDTFAASSKDINDRMASDAIALRKTESAAQPLPKLEDILNKAAAVADGTPSPGPASEAPPIKIMPRPLATSAPSPVSTITTGPALNAMDVNALNAMGQSPDRRTLACYKMTETGTCPDGNACPYSHSREVCQQRALKNLATALKSPMLQRADIAKVYAAHQSTPAAATSGSPVPVRLPSTTGIPRTNQSFDATNVPSFATILQQMPGWVQDSEALREAYGDDFVPK
jgi:hypothetical protein